MIKLPAWLSFRRRRGCFVVGLLLWSIVAAGEGWGIHHWWAVGAQARARLGQPETARPTQVGSPTEAVAEDLSLARRELAVMEAALVSHPDTSRTPGGRAEAYFELAGFVASSRQRARELGVPLGPEATHVGFAAYAKEGPDPAQIASVFRQQRIVSTVLAALLEAKPKMILSVRCERPLTEAERLAKSGRRPGARETVRANPRTDRAGGADYFSIDPRWSVFAEGMADTMGLRVAFTGDTATLRDFLNRLATAAIPILVRTIDVEPTARAEEGRRSPPVPVTVPASVVLQEYNAPGELPAPADRQIFARSDSKFTVTVEHVEIVSPTPGQLAQGSEAPAHTRRRWEPPRAQAMGAEWVFEVFTPPEMGFDARLNRFTVLPAVGGEEVVGLEVFGLELLSVRRETFRLQLIGDLGLGRDRRGVFEDRLTGEIFVAGAGARLPALDLEVASVELRRKPPEFGAGAETWQPGVVATVRSPGIGDVSLGVGEAGQTDSLIATVRTNEGQTFEERVGGIIEAGETRYLLEAISLQPAAVTVTKESAKPGSAERRVLFVGEERK